MMVTMYLSFKDCVLYEKDAGILADRYSWLNDAVIQFWFQLLQDEYSCSLFLPPCASFMIPFIDEEDILADTPDNQFRRIFELAEHGKKLCCVIMPVNNNSMAESAGGSHWSLLVAHTLVSSSPSTAMPAFLHFDSSDGMNETVARAMYEKIVSLFGWKGAAYEKAACPQQTNGCDCGAYALIFAETIAAKAERGDLASTFHADADAKRKEIRTVAADMSKVWRATSDISTTDAQ